MSTADTDPQSLSSESEVATEAPHGHGGEKASYDDINVPVIVMVGFVSTVLTFVSICGVQALYYHYENDQLRRKTYDVVHTPQTEITDEQRAKLMTYGHTIQVIEVSDTETDEITRITIPVENAMQQVLASEQANQQSAFPGQELPEQASPMIGD